MKTITEAAWRVSRLVSASIIRPSFTFLSCPFVFHVSTWSVVSGSRASALWVAALVWGGTTDCTAGWLEGQIFTACRDQGFGLYPAGEHVIFPILTCYPRLFKLRTEMQIAHKYLGLCIFPSFSSSYLKPQSKRPRGQLAIPWQAPVAGKKVYLASGCSRLLAVASMKMVMKKYTLLCWKPFCRCFNR